MKYLQLLLTLLIISYFSAAQLVVHVYDGDTYKVLMNGKFEVIRLANVDAPELKQYYGAIVKNKMSLLLVARLIKIDTYGKDRYGRIIADVRIGNMALDSLLITEGYAWHYTTYTHHPYLSIYETAAKNTKAGMWRCQYNVPPWIWRKLNKTQKRLKEMCR